MDGHLAVFDGERALAVAGLIGMEHGAVGVELGRVDAVGQGWFGGLFGLGRRFFLGGRGFRGFGGWGLFRGLGGVRGAGLCGFGLRRLGRAGGQQREQHQRSERKGDELLHSGFLPRWLGSGAEKSRPGARF